MKNKSIKIVAGIVIFSWTYIFSGIIPTHIFLKNGSAFDIVYKPLPAENVVYQQGKSGEHSYQENLISAGSGKKVSIGLNHNPLRLSIKRFGYGSGLSPWFDVPAPEDLAREQLTPDQLKGYEDAINNGRLPIITIRSSLAGWSFGIGYMK